MNIFFSVGEPSGDLHGANLVRHLARSGATTCGFGGPRMAAAGCDIHYDLTQLATMFLDGLAANLSTFLSLRSRAEFYFRKHRPDAVVLIDYPGFNWWVASAARRQSIPVIHYGLPQAWAWRSGRVRKLRRLTNLALCKLPFEAEWFGQRGCPALYAGHPYFDELHERTIDRDFIERQYSRDDLLLTLLPGSRDREVELNLPDLLNTARRLQARNPKLKVGVASFNDRQSDRARREIKAAGLEFEVHTGRTAELIDRATCCLACSGSVSLELLYHQVPSVILYRVSQLKKFLGQLVLRSRFITLPNLMAVDDIRRTRWRLADPNIPEDLSEMLIPEFLATSDCSEPMANILQGWLESPRAHQQQVERLGQLRNQVAQPGASQRAANWVVEFIRLYQQAPLGRERRIADWIGRQQQGDRAAEAA